MPNKISQRLKSSIHLTCYSCRHKEASHACQFEWDGVCYQLCLCNECASMGEKQLYSDFLCNL
ncbi:MAG: hypothetical protein KKF30_05130 [Proteobacteria bacterium]|nr:hypothetical protein [Pseudomonadota bacterium]MBU4472369.1 hypothetical protein [Pseudomonadota bacterium]MCG2752064.1 hypothetical protein [Desulfobacteraceae bacterium]